MLAGVDHLRQTYERSEQAFATGEPAWGAHLADELERLEALHDASTIAAVIVEPVAGSGGVIAPPKGYLARLREICTRHGILLIFDEVITGFGRTGYAFAAELYGVVPDMLNFAKCVTNGVIPLGGVICRDKIYDQLMNGPEHIIEFFHGYTYSGHPLACAAGLASLDVFETEGVLDNAQAVADYFQEAAHALRGLPHVIDVRTIGLVGGIELASRDGAPGARAYDVFTDCFRAGLLIRVTGDIIALSPPLIVEPDHMGRIAETIRAALERAG